jgi:hypothetical protein
MPHIIGLRGWMALSSMIFSKIVLVFKAVVRVCSSAASLLVALDLMPRPGFVSEEIL